MSHPPPFTDANPEGLLHGASKEEKLELLETIYLHVTEEGNEMWFRQRWNDTLTVAIVRTSSVRWDWCWTRTRGFPFEMMSRLPSDSGWEASPQGSDNVLWKRRSLENREWA